MVHCCFISMEEVLSSHDCLAVAVENFNIGDHMEIFTPCVVCNRHNLNSKNTCTRRWTTNNHWHNAGGCCHENVLFIRLLSECNLETIFKCTSKSGKIASQNALKSIEFKVVDKVTSILLFYSASTLGNWLIQCYEILFFISLQLRRAQILHAAEMTLLN